MRTPPPEKLHALRAAALCRDTVRGLTHPFYRYPGRFSPEFARAVIAAFTSPGDTVMDPFMGGGTTLVEAIACGRRAVGMDISSLAHFVTLAKTTLLKDSERARVKRWIERACSMSTVTAATELVTIPTTRNLQNFKTWRVRNWLASRITAIAELRTAAERRFVRAVLLRLGQWALDCRSDVPSIREVRAQLNLLCAEMLSGESELAAAVVSSGSEHKVEPLLRSAAGCETDERVRSAIPIKLVLTSPPYPGVHVVYNRWQILGRRETPAPFWIANVSDGNGLSYYTFGDRKSQFKAYLRHLRDNFKSITKVIRPDTAVVQLVGFADVDSQFPAYLNTLIDCGLHEIRFDGLATTQKDGRLWREVPNRKWYANRSTAASDASNEVVLIHSLTQ